MRYSTNTDLQAAEESFNTTADIIAADILRQSRSRLKANGPVHNIIGLMDLGLVGEVGRATPPVKIYRVGPDGELVLKEQIQATTFRRRRLEGAGGKAFQERIAELQRKRRRAGQRSKAKSRAARIRSGLSPRNTIMEEDEED